MICGFAIPGDISARTGGYGYARRLIREIDAEGVELRPVALPGSFPDPTRADIEESFDLIAAARAPVLIDGLALGALPADRLAALGKPLVGLCHHPLAMETGLSDERRQRLAASEAVALGACRRVVTTSEATAHLLTREFAVPWERITVARPGTDPAPRARGSEEHTVALLAVGALIPRKGYADLVAALAGLKQFDWHLTVAGSRHRDPAHADRIAALIERRGLERRVHLAGEMDEAALGRAYRRADIFVLPSRFEGYGMVYAEALARGLPVIGCDAGAVAEATATGGAILVEPGDVDALGDALTGLIADAETRQAMADAAWEGAPSLPRWSETAAAVAAALREARR